MEELQAAREKMEAFLKRTVDPPPGLRILLFQERAGFDAFVRPHSHFSSRVMKTLSGMYLPQPRRAAAFCIEELPYQADEKRRTAFHLFCHAGLDSHTGRALPIWVKSVLPRFLAAGDEDRMCLNRRMLVALAHGNTLGKRLFETTIRELIVLLNHWDEHAEFSQLEQYEGEAHSVLEYLGGAQAPGERRTALHALLTDRLLLAEPGKAIERHFGIGVEELALRWRGWVQEQGTGTFALPPPEIVCKLTHRLMPLIEDRQADPGDRILAVRRLGSGGHALGASALIEVLGRDDSIPREELIWALEAISGMPHGEDIGRWRSWWSSLPEEIREARRFIFRGGSLNMAE